MFVESQKPGEIISIGDDGAIRFRNEQGQLHREDGPAVVWPDGTKFWALEGKWHRENEPAIEWSHGGKEWYRFGKKHRVDGPAAVWPDGRKWWRLNGKAVSEQEVISQGSVEEVRTGTSTAKIFFAVEVRYIFGKRVRINPTWRTAMPVYVCYHGAGAEAQVQEEGCFLITDEHDRLWFCREAEQPDPNQPGFAEQFFRMGYLAHRLGIQEDGKMFHGNAENQDDLREELNAVE